MTPNIKSSTVSVWSLSLKCRLASFHNHVASIKSLQICPTTSGRAAGTILSIDDEGGFCILSLRQQICLLSDAGFGNSIMTIDWTLDGFLMVQRENGILKVTLLGLVLVENVSFHFVGG